MLPDNEPDRLRWNQNFEDTLLAMYGPPDKPTCNVHMSPALLASLGKSKSLSVETIVRSKELCVLQRDVAAHAVKYLGGDRLEDKWLALSQSRKEEIAFSALCRVSSIDGIEYFRYFCPETTVKKLAEDFICHLMFFLPKDRLESKDEAPMDTLLLIENSRFEDYVAPPPGQEEDLAQTVYYFRVVRTYFITLSVWYMMNNFYGVQEPIQLVKTGRRRGFHDDDVKRFLRSVGGDAQQAIKKSKKEYREAKASAIPSGCWHCRKSGEELEAEGKSVMVCAACNRHGLKIYYCSRECQVKDWNSGHKARCGKKINAHRPLNVPASPSSVAAKTDNFLATGIPLPDSSFRRSPALLHQISFLTKPGEKSDYIVMRPYPEPDFGIQLVHLTLRVVFLVWRRRAMKSGDKYAVARMYKALAGQSSTGGQRMLKQQLKDEYGVDVDSMGDLKSSGDDGNPTEEELRIVKEYLVRQEGR